MCKSEAIKSIINEFEINDLNVQKYDVDYNVGSITLYVLYKNELFVFSFMNDSWLIKHSEDDDDVKSTFKLVFPYEYHERSINNYWVDIFEFLNSRIQEKTLIGIPYSIIKKYIGDDNFCNEIGISPYIFNEWYVDGSEIKLIPLNIVFKYNLLNLN